MNLRRCFVGLVTLAAASCGHRGIAEVGPKAGAEPVRSRTIWLEPSEAGASYYLSRVDPSPQTHPCSAEIAASTSVAHALDPRLSNVAYDSARLYQQAGRLLPEAADFLRSHYGIAEPAPGLVLSRIEHAELSDVVSILAREIERERGRRAIARLGVACLEDGDAYIASAVFQERALEFDRIPRELGANSTLKFRAVLPEGFAEPVIIVTNSRGADVQVRVERRRDKLSAAIACTEGVEQVELLATDVSGPVVLANFPIYCGIEPPEKIDLDYGEAELEGQAAGRYIMQLINEERSRAGLAPLAWDPDAASVARGHSIDMRDGDFVAHVSPTTGSLGDRMERAGIRAPLILENVARALSPKDAHRGLMRSPGHRINILNPDVTHVGVGVARLDAEESTDLLVTEVFLRVPAPRDLSAVEEQVGRILRRKAGKGTEVDENLSAAAAEMAEALASTGGASAPELDRTHFKGYGSVLRGLEVVSLASSLRGAVFEQEGVVAYGFAVAEGAHPKLGDHALYVVILAGIR